MIKLNNVNKYFNNGKSNEIHVINDTSLTLPDNGLITFLGQSGSGKTTLLNVIGGLDSYKGEISYDDLSFNKYKMNQIDKFRRENVGYIFQNYNLLLDETVYDNLKFVLDSIGITDKKEQKKRITYVLKAVGMYKFRKKKADALSGGQQQRVSIARALVKKSKLILADEPTGNLDHENSIIVMNILKKISKTSLVLLVTHNEKIANFYSDRIYKIKDGKIIDEVEGNNKDVSLEASKNTIYLKEMEHHKEDNGFVNLDFYQDSDLDSPLNISIYYKNGTYYLESNENIRLVKDANIKIKNEKEKELDIKDVESFNYDDSIFDDSKKKYNPFISFGKYMKNMLKKMFDVKKKTKLLYFTFGLLGVCLAFTVLAYGNVYITPESNFACDASYSNFNSKSNKYIDIRKDRLTELASKGLIKDLRYNRPDDIYVMNFQNSANLGRYVAYASIYPYEEKTINLIKGTAPRSGEILISKSIADELLEQEFLASFNYEDLIGFEIQNANGYFFKVSGISDTKFKTTYINKEDYLFSLNERVLQTNHSYYLDGVEDNLMFRNYETEKSINSYKIISGRDLNESDLETKNILITNVFKQNEKERLLKEGYNIVGVFEPLNFFTKNGVIINRNNKDIELVPYPLAYKANQYQLVEGELPTKPNEILTSVYSKQQIGDTVNYLDSNFIVKGVFNAPLTVGPYLVDEAISESYALSIYSPSNISFRYDKSKINEINAIINDNDIIILNSFESIKRDELRKRNLIFGLLVGAEITIGIILVIFMYFLMRSRMLNDIYSIGVYRDLGVKKSQIYLKYTAEIIVLTSLTSLIGYLIGGYLFTSLDFVNRVTNMFVFGFNVPYFLVGIVLLYLISVIFGLLPLFILLRKTPSEINTKYDI